jgi:hypothetical protein
MTADQYESLGEFGLRWEGAPAVTRLAGSVTSLRCGTAQPDLVLLHGGRLNAHTWDVFALAAERPLLGTAGRHRPGGHLSGVRP